MPEFVHLHNHSHYSLLDGAAKIDQIVETVAEQGHKAFALTDHGNMFGVVEFYKKARAKGIKPIIGCEAYISQGKMTDKNSPVEGKRNYHLVLLAKNETGYKNLMKLTSMGYLEGFYFKPRVDKDALRRHSEGLIASTACLNGEVTYAAAQGDYEKAKKAALEYYEIFGEGNFYLELQRHRNLLGQDIERESIAREVVRKISADTGIPLVATNDAHYVNPAHHLAHDALICIGHGKYVSDTKRLKYDTKDIYIKTAAEMAELFQEVPEAIENTLRIAEMCNFELKLGEHHMPNFPIPPDSGVATLDDFLVKKAWEGLYERVPNPHSGYKERLEFELNVIKKMGFPGYFLITQDFIMHAKQNGIPVGPGRGSAAGSLVAYALRITDLDPLQYNLLFERFLNPERVSMPDIDVDFCYDRRGEVIDYIRQQYGDESVAQIITFNKLKARAVIRDVGRVLEVPISETDRVAKLVPDEVGITLEEALKKNPELKTASESDETHKKLFDYSLVLEGMNRNAGKHAAGVVIAPGKLTDYVPLYKPANEDSVMSQYDMKSLEEAGLIKMDFLGLRTLTVINDAVQLVKQFRGKTVDIEGIPLDDPEVFKLFGEGNTIGLFQFESTGMREYLKKLKPTIIGDLIAMNALYRPGPMDNINDFIARKHGEQEIELLDDIMEPILRETYGIIVYQEQVMQLGSTIAGLTLAEADIMRRAMGKKNKALMDEMKVKFIAGAKKNGITEKKARDIWDLIEKFAKYGFNKSHSAAYSLVAYRTGWLKRYYPVEFMAANLTSEKDDSKKILLFLNECKNMSIRVIPPDVNRSHARFFPGGEDSILFGLNAIKKVGTKAAESIEAERQENGPFADLFDFTSRVDTRMINKGVLENLITSGAMDSLPGTRQEKHSTVEIALQHGQRVQAMKNTDQTDLFGTGGKPETIRPPEMEPLGEWDTMEKLNRERDAIGFYLTGHPLQGYEDEVRAFSTLDMENLDGARDGDAVKVGGLISGLKIHYDRKGNQMAFFTLNGLDGFIECLIFSDGYERHKHLIYNDCLVFLEGAISRRPDEDPKIMVSQVLKIEEARNTFSRQIHLAFDPLERTTRELDDLYQLARRYAGPCQLVFHLRHSKSTEKIVLARNIRVSANGDFLTSLKGQYGESNVWFTK